MQKVELAEKSLMKLNATSKYRVVPLLNHDNFSNEYFI